MKAKKIINKSAFVLLIILIGGTGGILANRYIFPYISATKIFSKYEWLRKSAEETTIINKTEQVYVKEETSISKIAQNTLSSVVNIISKSQAESTASYRRTTLVTASQNQPSYKNGAGLIVTSDGLIMTHLDAIIREKASYKVMTATGDQYDGELVGIDNYSNLAFIKVNSSNLSAAAFGNSDDIKSGEKVIAIGNDQGNYQNRYAAGLISQYNSQYNISELAVASSEKLEGVFQADFNYQHSFVGGPIIDYAGNVIGVVGSVTRDNKQEFFQIPSNTAKLIIDKAIKQQLTSQAKLGVYYLSINETLANAKNLPRINGALVYSSSGQTGLAVIDGLPAQKSGVKAGDIIISIGSDEINQNTSLSELINKYSIGSSIEIGLLRNGQEIKLKVQL